MNRKIVVGVAAGAVLLAAGWAGASAWMGSRLEEQIVRAAQSSANPGSAILAANVQHRRGLFSSEGSFDTAYQVRCVPTELQGLLPRFQVRYQVNHMLVPGQLARVSWSLQPLDEAEDTMRQLFGKSFTIQGEGTIDQGGMFASTFAIPGLQHVSDAATFELAPSTGNFASNGEKISFDWGLDRVSVRAKTGAVALTGLRVATTIEDQLLGLGFMRMSIDAIEGPGVNVQGTSIESRLTTSGDALKSESTFKVGDARTPTGNFSDVDFGIDIGGGQRALFETLAQTYRDSCGAVSLTDAEQERMLGALQSLLATDFRIDTRATGKGDQGSLQGSASLSLAKAAANEADWMPRLRSDGKVMLRLNDRNQSVALAQAGLGQLHPDGVEANYRLENGELLVNGEKMDPAPIVASLMGFAGQIQANMQAKGARGGAVPRSSPGGRLGRPAAKPRS